ncbi:MAG: serine/threonine protein kinase [Gammaproteobacteria bacterium]|nr:serine/threonine protein kinase [Gammaproteobacteria bacterium]
MNQAALTLPPAVEKVGRYEILKLIGEGTSGIVYRAWDPVLDREVAIKLARNDNESAEKLDLVAAEFRHEAEIAGKFAHENIVTIYDCVSAGDNNYLVMEYVPGRSLDGYMTAVGPLRLAEVLAIAYECCVGLAFIHYHGVIHRDIKPGNVMYHPAHRLVKLMDFSLAHRIEERPPRVNGTVAYMAPEHFDSARKISHLTDVFALGSTIYRLLTGHYPFSREHTAFHILHHEPEPITTYRPNMPGEVADLIAKAMAKADPDRYQSAAEFASAVESVARNIYPDRQVVNNAPRYLGGP